VRFTFIALSLLCARILFAGEKDIVIVHSYGKAAMDWVLNQGSGFKKVMGDHYIYHEMFLKTKQIPSSEFSGEAERALTAIRHLKPSLVYLTDDNVFRLISGKIPKSTFVVFSGLNGDLRKDYPWFNASSNINGVLERPLVKRSLVQILSSFTQSFKKILLLMGESDTAKAILNNDFGGKKNSLKLGSTEVNMEVSNSFSFWQKSVKGAVRSGYDALVAIGFYKLTDDNKKIIDPEVVASFIASHGGLPSFTIHKAMVGKDKITAALTLDGILEGEAAGRVALNLIKDGKRVQFPEASSTRVFIVSLSELQRFGLTLKESTRPVMTE